MVRRILKTHEVVALDINPESVAEAAEFGGHPVKAAE